MSMTPNEFKEWRNGMGWSQAVAARELGLSVSCVSNYENGVRRGDGKISTIPMAVSLACKWLAIIPVSGQPHQYPGMRDFSNEFNRDFA